MAPSFGFAVLSVLTVVTVSVLVGVLTHKPPPSYALSIPIYPGLPNTPPVFRDARTQEHANAVFFWQSDCPQLIYYFRVTYMNFLKELESAGYSPDSLDRPVPPPAAIAVVRRYRGSVPSCPRGSMAWIGDGRMISGDARELTTEFTSTLTKLLKRK